MPLAIKDRAHPIKFHENSLADLLGGTRHFYESSLYSKVWEGKGRGMIEEIPPSERIRLQAELERVQQECHDLEAAICALLATHSADQIQVQRLKKRKITLRERIIHLEDRLFPDIIA